MRAGWFDWNENRLEKLRELWRYRWSQKSLQKFFHVGQVTLAEGKKLANLPKRKKGYS